MYSNKELISLNRINQMTHAPARKQAMHLVGPKKYLKIAVDTASLVSVALVCYFTVYVILRIPMTFMYILTDDENMPEVFDPHVQKMVRPPRGLSVEFALDDIACRLFDRFVESPEFDNE